MSFSSAILKFFARSSCVAVNFSNPCTIWRSSAEQVIASSSLFDLSIGSSNPKQVPFTASANNANVYRTRTYVLGTYGSSTYTLIATVENSVEGLTNLSILWNNGV